MTIALEHKHVGIIDKLIHDINKRGRILKIREFNGLRKYSKAAERKNISVEDKKRILMDNLYALTVKTFALNVNKLDNKRALNHIKNNLLILRKIVIKLLDINYYLETTFLEEIGLVKQKYLFDKTKGQINNSVGQDYHVLDKNEFDRLDHLVFNLIDKILFFDKKLLKEYRLREIIIIKNEKLTKQIFKGILIKESELLHHLEAKFPPASYATIKLLKPGTYTIWVSRIFSLLAAIRHNFYKEQEIIKKLKKGRGLKDKIERKIIYLISEKRDILKVKEKKILGWEETMGLDKEWQKLSHDWSTISKL